MDVVDRRVPDAPRAMLGSWAGVERVRRVIEGCPDVCPRTGPSDVLGSATLLGLRISAKRWADKLRPRRATLLVLPKPVSGGPAAMRGPSTLMPAGIGSFATRTARTCVSGGGARWIPKCARGRDACGMGKRMACGEAAAGTASMQFDVNSTPRAALKDRRNIVHPQFSSDCRRAHRLTKADSYDAAQKVPPQLSSQQGHPHRQINKVTTFAAGLVERMTNHSPVSQTRRDAVVLHGTTFLGGENVRLAISVAMRSLWRRVRPLVKTACGRPPTDPTAKRAPGSTTRCLREPTAMP